MSQSLDHVVAIIPAAGVGQRMGANIPKQYLEIDGISILSHTVKAFLNHPKVDVVIVAVSKDDQYFDQLPESNHSKLVKVQGGSERANTVLESLKSASQLGYEDSWALVHDAARPCITRRDIDLLLKSRENYPNGAILAMPVRDTMKRADSSSLIKNTVCRELLWHAMTPQMFVVSELQKNLNEALNDNVLITDESSAMEWAGINPGLISGRADNIKVTHAEDLQLAALYLSEHKKNEIQGENS
ncbi:2-C-methyl-D-erythritol 4-phosphate cytidylyltransferase [Parashewanella spongiae]|uniref:2-C-methyl-D-erythritol 4-phosphate cytidylyltransferase n=1 Tax=Parashewanella spongiae TaxID=342950 RepID=A0A3A6U942_9GAMM|nr:2-C-methyl-D-erythritol 4-phosphate cytidylyltransferase [Parashewanella spongiae]MCL1077798.1 2-C-methyl-D-erythritol 4-phosphate cytidylyltransferase [Parashewanella spongiae]RJY18025.1 2-C-methyl-D-erythritol 4-phosphate cytidylyltransferase [Parashewanella spongiae]